MPSLLTCSETDPMYLSSVEVMKAIMRRMREYSPAYQPIISLGVPKILLPLRWFFNNPLLYVYEMNPGEAFNCQELRQLGKKVQYRDWVSQELKPIGWENVVVRHSDLKYAVHEHPLDRTPHLMLLDTCNIGTISETRMKIKSRFGSVHPHSVVMFNTQPNRSTVDCTKYGTPSERAARDLFENPRLLAEVQYEARGTKRVLRTLSFYTGAESLVK